MWNYAASIVFWCAFTYMLYALGNVLIHEKEGQAVKFTAGYLVYSFFVAVGGMVVQLLNIKWIVFAVYMSFLIIGIIGLILYTKKKRGYIFTETIKDYFSANWFMFAFCIVLCFMLLLYFRSFWYGNYLDDGYYLTKVAVIAHDGGNYSSNLSVGLGKGVGLSYLLNTWELEASFFVNVLKITPSLFLRFFQSGFNYFVFFNCVLAFGEKILSGVGWKDINKTLQYVLGIFLVFFVHFVYMWDTGIFFLRDSFQLNTGMYYGSAISKLTVVICLLMFYIQEEKINWKMIIGVGAISIVMISKSSVVLPILVVMIVASCITWLTQSKIKAVRIVGLGLGVAYIIIGIVLPGDWGIQHETYQYVKLMVKSPIMWVAAIIFIYSFTIKEKVIYRLNCIMIISACMIIIPEINDIFEKCSVFAFVGGRAWSMWAYAFVIMNAFYLYIILIKHKCKDVIVKTIYGIVTCGMTVLLVYGFVKDGTELFETDQIPPKAEMESDIQVLLHNRKFMPNSTVELGEVLEDIYENTGDKLYVLSPQGAVVDNTIYSLSIQLRSVAPDVISVSAVERYGVDKECELYGYDQEKYEEFIVAPNNQTFKALEKEIDKYNINCVVVQNEKCGEYLERVGFQRQRAIENNVYYIWYRP